MGVVGNHSLSCALYPSGGGSPLSLSGMFPLPCLQSLPFGFVLPVPVPLPLLRQ